MALEQIQSRSRRRLFGIATLPLLPNAAWSAPPAESSATALPLSPRARPGDAGWPSAERWQALAREVGDAFINVRSPLDRCLRSPPADDCMRLFKSLKNPYFLGDDVALTQTLGWVDAWTSKPSVYAVTARHASDIVATVNFARENRLRLVIKGGGHSYQGTSNATDSLLVWTRRMSSIQLHEAFVAQGCTRETASRAVSVGAGALWSHVYDAVTTQGGGYVQAAAA